MVGGLRPGHPRTSRMRDRAGSIRMSSRRQCQDGKRPGAASVERPFGTIEAWMDATHTLTKMLPRKSPHRQPDPSRSTAASRTSFICRMRTLTAARLAYRLARESHRWRFIHRLGGHPLSSGRSDILPISLALKTIRPRLSMRIHWFLSQILNCLLVASRDIPIIFARVVCVDLTILSVGSCPGSDNRNKALARRPGKVRNMMS
jgi:hypothetical protein